MNSFGLFLSHDPSKAPYETGAWSALQQMRIPLSCIIGHGMNAFNAALLAQNDYQKYASFWQDDLINSFLQLHDEMVRKSVHEKDDAFDEKLHLDFFSALKDTRSQIFFLKEQLSKYIDENLIRKSSVCLGLVTFDASECKNKPFWINDIPGGKLVDLLIFNLVFPEAIQSDHNLTAISDPISPIDFINEKAEQLLILDTPAPELRRKLKAKKIGFKSIKPSIFLPPCSGFEPKKTKEQIQTAALDCMKAFGHLYGNKYYFNQKKHYALFNRFCITFGQKFENETLISRFAQFAAIEEDHFKNNMIDFVNRLMKKTLLSKSGPAPQTILEICGQKMQIEKRQIYTLDALIFSLISTLECNIEKHLESIKKTGIQNFVAKYDSEPDRHLLNTEEFILLYAWMTTPNQKINAYQIQKISENLLPEDILALLGFVYLNLTIKSL